MFFPADEYSSEAVEPAVGAFDNPAACLVFRTLGGWLGFLAARGDVCGKAEFLQEFSDFVEVVSLVEAHVLLAFFRWPWSLGLDSFEGFAG